MPLEPLSRLRRLLRSPRTITAELLGIALAGFATTFVEQHPTALARERLAEDHPVLARLVAALALDHVFTAPWFLAIVALAAGSLAIVCWEQWSRLLREWSTPGEAWFRGAPYRRTVERARTGEGRRVTITRAGRIGALGSPLFHAGLLVVAVAGFGRMVLGADTSRETWEGGIIPADAGAFAFQDLGPLARPIVLGEPVKLVELRPSWYPSGSLLGLAARVEVGEGRPVTLAVNEPLDVGGTRIYLTQGFGPAAVLEVVDPANPSVGLVLLTLDSSGDFSGVGKLPGGEEVRVRAPYVRGERRPAGVADVRVLDRDVLLGAGRMQPGSVLELPGGRGLALREMRWWARLAASRDPTAWPVFVGFGLSILGVILMFGFVRVDTLVVAEPDGERERVTVAMRPQRLVPIFAERFERRVEREAGGR